ncbi:MAG: DUF2085 domain-containing protein [Coriobacteriia bacterium]|nr:DUF2085 domain-containing protein [Coriobacteriia bacterium]
MLQSFLCWLGYGLCHQLPERSFLGGGIQLPVCARDTGIYIGIVVSLAVIALLHRGSHPREFPNVAGWVAVAVMIGVMAVDGVTEYSGLRSTTNDLRLITGLAAGFALGAILAPILNDEVWCSSSAERVLAPGWRLAVWLGAVPVSFALIRWGAPVLGEVYPILTAVAIIGALCCVNLVILCVLPPFERRATSLRDLWPVLVVALALSFAEIWAAGAMRHFLESLVARF